MRTRLSQGWNVCKELNAIDNETPAKNLRTPDVYRDARLRCVLPHENGSVGVAIDAGNETFRFRLPTGDVAVIGQSLDV